MIIYELSKNRQSYGIRRKRQKALSFIGNFTWGTFLGLRFIFLILLSLIRPVWAAFFIIVFDVYWLLLVLFLGIYLFIAYLRLKSNKAIDWEKKM